MQVEIEIKNYRCFSGRPVKILLKPGFISFIGVNNVGKSTLLRFFFEYRNLFNQYLASRANPAILNHSTGISANTGRDAESAFSDRNDRGIEIAFTFNNSNLKPTNSLSRAVIKISRIGEAIIEIYSEQNVKLQGNIHFAGDFLKSDTSSIIISPLFELLEDITSTLYIGPFRNLITTGGAGYYDISVGEAFVLQWDNLKTGSSKTNSQSAYEVTERIKNIFDLKDLQINASSDKKTLHVFLNGKSYLINELGSGLAEFIVVLINAALRKPAYILIDEPESHLHPSLQIDFLTTLASYASKGLFFSTHSMGLARSVSQIIYSVRKAEAGSEVSMLDKIENYAEFLGELSYSGYRELGYSKVLLVEGRTEVTTILQLLRLYGKEHKIVMVPLGGGEMITGKAEIALTELQRLSSDVVVLIDSERDAKDAPLEKSREEFLAICNRLGFVTHVTERRATENYFTQAAIDAAFHTPKKALAPYEEQSGWDKTDNWKIAIRMTKRELVDTDLDDFFSAL